jgi:hypothetical protein
MDHSIAAKYAARPAAHFVRPPNGVRERHLGLRPSGSFITPGSRSTFLPGRDVASLTQLRAGWRTIHPVVSARPRSGRPRPSVTMEWARSGYPGTVRRPGAASAPWPA